MSGRAAGPASPVSSRSQSTGRLCTSVSNGGSLLARQTQEAPRQRPSARGLPRCPAERTWPGRHRAAPVLPHGLSRTWGCGGHPGTAAQGSSSTPRRAQRPTVCSVALGTAGSHVCPMELCQGPSCVRTGTAVAPTADMGRFGGTGCGAKSPVPLGAVAPHGA